LKIYVGRWDLTLWESFVGKAPEANAHFTPEAYPYDVEGRWVSVMILLSDLYMYLHIGHRILSKPAVMKIS